MSTQNKNLNSLKKEELKKVIKLQEQRIETLQKTDTFNMDQLKVLRMENFELDSARKAWKGAFIALGVICILVTIVVTVL